MITIEEQLQRKQIAIFKTLDLKTLAFPEMTVEVMDEKDKLKNTINTNVTKTVPTVTLVEFIEKIQKSDLYLKIVFGAPKVLKMLKWIAPKQINGVLAILELIKDTIIKIVVDVETQQKTVVENKENKENEQDRTSNR